jgi:ABC-type spermidine/putrescine transport system permease subunit I
MATAGPRLRRALTFVVLIPFWTSILVRSFAWIVLLQRRGLVNPVLMGLGLTSQPLALVYNRAGVLIGMVQILLPFMVFPLYSVMSRVDATLAPAAGTLGAPPVRTFLRVTLPLTLPGLVTGVLLVFIPMTGEYVIPSLLGGGKREFVGNAVGDQFLVAQNWPFGAAMAIGLLLVLSIFLIVYLTFATKEQQFGA